VAIMEKPDLAVGGELCATPTTKIGIKNELV
jgi:hypothetical protein